MRAARVQYRSTRTLAGYSALGDVTSTAKTGGAYADYAKAIYQAINGDVAGGAYSAAIAYAGPIAAIGNAVANYLNKKGDIKSATTSALLDALVANAGWKVQVAKNIQIFIMPNCKYVRADEYARAASEALRLEKSPEEVSSAFRAWMNTAKPYYGACTPAPLFTETESVASTPAPVVSPPAPYVPPYIAPIVTIAPPTPTPTPMPSPTPAPISTVAPIVSVPVNDVPVVATSVAPDQTPALIAKMIADGASRDQAFNAAMASLAARRIPPTPQVQQMVASDISRAVSPPQMASTMWIVFAAAALFGVSLIFGSGSR